MVICSFCHILREMTYRDGALFGLLGCFLYELVINYKDIEATHKWPWQDKKKKLTLGMFIFGICAKFISAVSLAAMMTYTGQISGAWAAFITGMVADRTIIILGDKALKDRSK